MGSYLWDYICGIIFVGSINQYLILDYTHTCYCDYWDYICGIIFLGLSLWDYICGIIFVGLALWDYICGIIFFRL